MSRIYRQLPPPGTRIGLAFSGGLDTRAAVAWMTKRGVEVYAYTADLAQPDEKNVNDIPPLARTHGREGRQAHRLPRGPGARRSDCHSVRGLPPLRGRAALLQHHPTGSRGDRHRHRARDEG